MKRTFAFGMIFLLLAMSVSAVTYYDDMEGGGIGEIPSQNGWTGTDGGTYINSSVYGSTGWVLVTTTTGGTLNYNFTGSDYPLVWTWDQYYRHNVGGYNSFKSEWNFGNQRIWHGYDADPLVYSGTGYGAQPTNDWHHFKFVFYSDTSAEFFVDNVSWGGPATIASEPIENRFFNWNPYGGYSITKAAIDNIEFSDNAISVLPNFELSDNGPVQDATMNDNSQVSFNLTFNNDTLPVSCGLCFGGVGSCVTLGIDNISVTSDGIYTFNNEQQRTALDNAGLNDANRHYYLITCSDAEESYTIGYIGVDIEMSPQLTLVAPQDGPINNDTTFDVTVFDDDDYTNVSCELQFNNSGWQVIDTTTTGAFNTLIPFNQIVVQDAYTSYGWMDDGFNHSWQVECTDGLTTSQYVAGGSFELVSGCIPNWYCSSFDRCKAPGTQMCMQVIDSKGCGEEFTGNRSDFDSACEYVSSSGSGGGGIGSYVATADGKIVGRLGIIYDTPPEAQEEGTFLSLTGKGSIFDVKTWSAELWVTIKGWFVQ